MTASKAMFGANRLVMDRHAVRSRLILPPSSRRGDHDLNPGFEPPGGSLAPAAVLVPLVDRPEGLTVLLTRRTTYLNMHAGQICFPGGKAELDDADAVATALRETHEEVGLPKEHVDVIGMLDRYVTRTGFDITPVVGLIVPPFPVSPDPSEVDEVFEVPLEYLLDPGNRKKDSRQIQGITRYYYAMPFGDYYIWGATAGMLVNLAARLMPETVTGAGKSLC